MVKPKYHPEQGHAEKAKWSPVSSGMVAEWTPRWAIKAPRTIDALQ